MGAVRMDELVRICQWVGRKGKKMTVDPVGVSKIVCV